MRITSISAALLAAAFFAATTPVRAATVVIDDFDTGQSFSSCDFPPFGNQAGAMIYGRRVFIGGCQKFQAGSNVTVASGELSYGAGGTEAIVLDAIYSATLPLGSGNAPVAVDLTSGGTNDGLLIRIHVTGHTLFTFTVANASESASRQIDLAPGASFIDLALPFASFSAASASLWQSATSVSYSIVDPGPAAANGFYRASGEIDFIRAVPEPGTGAMLCLGVLALAGVARRRAGHHAH